MRVYRKVTINSNPNDYLPIFKMYSCLDDLIACVIYELIEIEWINILDFLSEYIN